MKQSVDVMLDSMEYVVAMEDRKQVDAWLDSHQRKMGMFIDGTWVHDTVRTSFPAVMPCTGELLAQLTQADGADVEAAVDAARRAQPVWAAIGDHKRACFLYALARLIQKHHRFLAVLESLDNGKPIRESRDIDTILAARHFYHHAGWAQLCRQEFSDYRPIGVVAQIIPWNFPLLMFAWKVAPALAAGNTVVIKPAEQTSLTALKMAELCAEAGLPPGVVNVVTGNGEVGAALVKSKVDKIAFTGSTEVGKAIRHSLAGSHKKLTLELGGKSPFLVFDDADLDSAVEGLVDAIWFNQGQVCCAGSRLLVQESIADVFLAKTKDRMSSLRVGHSLDKYIDVGAIIDAEQKEKIESLLQQGQSQGAEIWQAPCKLPQEGFYFAPTLVTNAAPGNVLMQEEIFGPVLSAITFRTQAEAIALANNTRYGLAASVWSETLSRALEVAPLLQCGVVWVNGTNMFDATSGFGGYRESGFGREGGREGMSAYLTPKFEAKLPTIVTPPLPKHDIGVAASGVDHTAKMYIGGKQTRPDGGYSMSVYSANGSLAGLVGLGNRKDIRNAVQAALKAKSWRGISAHGRAQVLYFIAENLDFRRDEFAQYIQECAGYTRAQSKRDVKLALERIFAAAALADKFDGAVHAPPLRGVVLAMHEPVGVIGIICPSDSPFLAFVTLLSHAIALGNTVVIVPHPRYALLATSFYQVLSTSDVPDGVVNIITGEQAELVKSLSQHDGVNSLWCFGDDEMCKTVEHNATANMKRTWLANNISYPWADSRTLTSRWIIEHSLEVKNIWIPYGNMNNAGSAY